MNAKRAFVRPHAAWAVAVIAVLLVGGVVWGYLVSGEATASAPPTPVSTVPSTPTVYPTPDPGTTDEVPAVEPEVVDVDEVDAPVEGVEARVVSMERVEVSGTLPGETAGPALEVVVEVVNTGETEIDSRGATLTVDFGADRVPGSEIQMDSDASLPDSIRPGQHVTAVGTYSIPDGTDGGVQINLDLLAGKPVVVFQGDLPGA